MEVLCTVIVIWISYQNIIPDNGIKLLTQQISIAGMGYFYYFSTERYNVKLLTQQISIAGMGYFYYFSTERYNVLYEAEECRNICYGTILWLSIAYMVL